MAPAKLKIHLTTNHSHLTSKCAYYFKQLLEYRNKQSKAFVKNVTISEKAQEAGYLVTELVAQKWKSHTVGENPIMPTHKIIVSRLLGQVSVREIEGVPLLNRMISRRIDDMLHEAEEVFCKKLKKTASISRLISQQMSPVNIML
jgi:hypothetical protein